MFLSWRSKKTGPRAAVSRGRSYQSTVALDHDPDLSSWQRHDCSRQRLSTSQMPSSANESLDQDSGISVSDLPESEARDGSTPSNNLPTSHVSCLNCATRKSPCSSRPTSTQRLGCRAYIRSTNCLGVGSSHCGRDSWNVAGVASIP